LRYYVKSLKAVSELGKMINEIRIRFLLREYFLRRECEEHLYLDEFFDLGFKDGRNIIAIKLACVHHCNQTMSRLSCLNH